MAYSMTMRRRARLAGVPTGSGEDLVAGLGQLDLGAWWTRVRQVFQTPSTHLPIGTGRCVTPKSTVTGGVSLAPRSPPGDVFALSPGADGAFVGPGGHGTGVGVDAIAPQYLREGDATAFARARRSAIGRRRTSAILAGYPTGTGEELTLGHGFRRPSTRAEFLGQQPDAHLFGLGQYAPEQYRTAAAGNPQASPATAALTVGKVVGGFIHTSANPERHARNVSDLNAALRGDSSALYHLIQTMGPENRAARGLTGVAPAIDGWATRVMQDEAAAFYDQVAATGKGISSVTPPGGVPTFFTPPQLPGAGGGSPAVGPGTASGSSILSDVAQGFFETPAGQQAIQQYGPGLAQGAARAQVTRAATWISENPLLVTTALGAIVILATRRR